MTLKQTAAAALIGGALALSSSDPATAQDNKPKTVEERLTEIEKKLDTLTQALKGKKDSDGYAIPLDKGLIEDVKSLKSDLSALKTEIEGMKKSTSFRAVPAADAMAGKGTVRIENKYPVEVTVTLNGVNRRVDGGATAEYVVPSGEFTYTLLSGLDPVQQRGTVAEKQVATLRVK